VAASRVVFVEAAAGKQLDQDAANRTGAGSDSVTVSQRAAVERDPPPECTQRWGSAPWCLSHRGRYCQAIACAARALRAGAAPYGR